MMKKQEGILTVEAAISLTAYLFAMMFLVNVGQVYRAQNYMVHGLVQTGQMLAFSSFEYGLDNQNRGNITLDDLVDAGKRLFGQLSGSTGAHDIKKSWRSGRYPEAAKLAFGYCAGRDAGETDKYLKRYGITGGVDSIDFAETCCAGKDLYIRTQYRVELPFAFFNISHIDMHQQIVCGLWEQ